MNWPSLWVWKLTFRAFSFRYSLWRGANARNVSFQTQRCLISWSSTQLKIPNFGLVTLYHRRSTTVSSESTHFISSYSYSLNVKSLELIETLLQGTGFEMGTERACRLLHSILVFALNPLFPTNDKPQIFPYYFITESNIKDTRKKEMITQLSMLNFLFQWLHQSLQVQKKTSVLHVWLTLVNWLCLFGNFSARLQTYSEKGKNQTKTNNRCLGSMKRG